MLYWNTLKDGLCYLRNESVSMKVFLLNMHEARILFDLGKPARHLIYSGYYFFSYENYWPCLTWSSKCRGSVSHGDIKFWFSGSANTGRHCLLLQFHLSYSIRCIMNFKKIADTSLKAKLSVVSVSERKSGSLTKIYKIFNRLFKVSSRNKFSKLNTLNIF